MEGRRSRIVRPCKALRFPPEDATTAPTCRLEYDVRILSRCLPAILLAVSTAAATTPAPAADFTEFRAACVNGAAFLIGEVPEGKNAQPVMDALCPCLETGFAAYTQAEIDALEADLRTGTNDEARATYPAYQELQSKATGVLGTCFSSDAVMAAARAEGL